MAGLLFIKMDFIRPPWLPARLMRRCLMLAHKSMPEFWQRHYIRKHFDQPASGGGTYGYSPRSDLYVKGKKNPKNIRRHRIRDGGEHALVYTGATRKRLLAGRGHLRAWPNRATLAMIAPLYVHMRATGNRPPLGDEITRQRPSEIKATQKEAGKVFYKEINAQRSKGRKIVQA
ncbi:MAG TPA: hypothetical protein VMY42_12680 [Thermoguttaceae bacterium]|nr:hypothetical protein [Thermoguttaceae bacterium]